MRRQAVATCASKPAVFGADFFAELLRESFDPICLWYAARSLGTLQSIAHLPLLIALLRKPDVAVGQSSLHRITASSIGLIGPSALRLIAPLLHAAEKHTQLAAIDTLGEIRAPEGAPLLADCLASEDLDIALWAALSLSKIGPPALATLTRHMNPATPARTFLIIDALVMMCRPDVLPSLAVVVQDYAALFEEYLRRAPTEKRAALIMFVRYVAASSTGWSTNAQDILRFLEAHDDDINS